MPPTGAPQPMQTPTPAPAPQPHSRLPLYMWIVAIVVVFAVAALVYSLRTSGANSDYICTKVVELTGNCSNGAWSDWTQTSQSTDGGVTTTNYQRTYTGTREVSKTLTYLNLRTSCQSGYTQSGNGGAGGASGFHGGYVTTTQTACQVIQTQTVVKTAGPSGANSKWTITNAQSDLGGTSTTQHNVGSLDELNANANGNGGNYANAGGEIAVQPSLVRQGQTTTVTWNATGVDTCTVSSDGGDSFAGVAGSQTSKPIMRQTTFTLTCPVGGTNVTATAVVNVTPVFQEQ